MPPMHLTDQNGGKILFFFDKLINLSIIYETMLRLKSLTGDGDFQMIFIKRK